MQTAKKVLVVEDDPDLRFIITRFLEQQAIEYLTAEDGLQAIGILTSNSIDILMTDFQMPHFNGIQLLKWCRTRSMHLPVIFISSDADLMDEEKIALEDCCATLLPKPIDFLALTRALDAAIHLSHHPECVHR